MLLTDWLDALRGSRNSSARRRRRRKFPHDLARAAEILEYKAAPNGSFLAMAGGGGIQGLQSLDESSPPLTEDQADPLETFTAVSPDDSDLTLEESTDSVAQTQDTSNLKPSDDVVGGILPDVMDTLLLSPLNEPAAPSPLTQFTPPPSSSTPLETPPAPISGSGAVGSPPPMSLGAGASQSGTSSPSGDQSAPTGIMSGPAPSTQRTSPNTSTTSLQTATFTTLTVTNSPPVADDDHVSLNEDASATFDVLANDSDPDGDTIFITDVTQGGNGTVSFTANDVTYTANSGYWGPDQFSYTIDDGNGGMDTASVYVTVVSVNHAPVATDDNVSTDEDTSATFDVLANDSDHDHDPLFITDVTQGANGEVDFTDTDVSYTPYADFWGTDQFSYTINDGDGGTATAYVNVTVDSVNDFPVAVDDNVSLDEGATAAFTVLTNDSDVDGDTLSITGATQGFSGTVNFTASNVSYTPYDPNFNGTDQFSYDISDGNGGYATAYVNVTVNPVNDDPVANADYETAPNEPITTDEDTPVTIDVLSNDTDIDGDLLFITAVTNGANGTVTFTSHDLTYTPAKDWSGSDQFSYRMKDGHGGEKDATVDVTVNPVEDLPVANTDYKIIGEGGSATFDLIGNDFDAEGPVTVITYFPHLLEWISSGLSARSSPC